MKKCKKQFPNTGNKNKHTKKCKNNSPLITRMNFSILEKKLQKDDQDNDYEVERMQYFIKHREELLYPIPDIPGYQITKDGRIWSIKSNKFIAQRIVNGYKLVNINNIKNVTVHRLVANIFIPNPKNRKIVDHIDSDKLNNHVTNLRWVTQKENTNAHDKEISHSRRVYRINPDGNIVATYDTVTGAGKAVGKDRTTISKLCLGINGKDKEGYTWRFENEEHNHEEKVDLSKGKHIYDFENYYVFPTGRIYNINRKKYLKPVINASGYAYITLCKGMSKADGKRKQSSHKENHYIQRLVAEHFIKNTDEKKIQVNHKNKIRHDNRVENLEWVTISENMIHANKYAKKKTSSTKS